MNCCVCVTAVMVPIMYMVTSSPPPPYTFVICMVLVLLLTGWRLFTLILKNHHIQSKSRSTRLNGYKLIDLCKVSGFELLPDNPRTVPGAKKKKK